MCKVCDKLSFKIIAQAKSEFHLKIKETICIIKHRELIDSGSYVCGVFVDLEKAFDTVCINHKMLFE